MNASMRKSWWKVLCAVFLAYTIIGGLLMPVPKLAIIHQSIRNLFFHVPMWFTMMALFFIGFVYAIKYLRSGALRDDIVSTQFVSVGLIFGCLGMATGMEWARFTWGEAWSNDPKQTCAALTMLIYFAYLALRGAIPDYDKRAKIASVYNIFAFALMIPLIWVIPSMTDSLHPGSGGNAGFNTYDLDNDLRKIFYPAVIGWALLGVWISTLFIRIKLLAKKDILNEKIN
jgi:heme exporter protein C